MKSKTLCEPLLDALAQAGARQICGVTGAALNPFLETTRRRTLSKLREAVHGVCGDHAQWENWQEELR